MKSSATLFKNPPTQVMIYKNLKFFNEKFKEFFAIFDDSGLI